MHIHLALVHRVRSWAGVTAVIVLAGCVTAWQPHQAAPAELLEQTGETEIRVTQTSGRKTTLRDPAVERDSLIGWVKPAFDDTSGPARVAIPLRDVREVAVKKNDFGPNLILGAVAGTALFFVTISAIWIISCATSYCD